MRIVLCCRVYSTHMRVGGMIHVVVERAEELVRQGHEIHVITTSSPGQQISQVVNGVNVISPRSGEPQQYSDLYASVCELACKDLKPDIIHLDSWDKHRIWWSQFKSKCRVAITNHGEAIGSQLTDWRLRLHGRSVSTPGGESDEIRCEKCTGDLRTCEWTEERNQLLKADVVIATCRFDRWMLSDLLGLPNVRLVYNPLAPYHFERRSQPQRDPTSKLFLAIGVWGHGERGFDVARESCIRIHHILNTPVNVGRRELVGWYDLSKALLLPGFQSKGYDLAVAESIARLRPVVMADNGVATMEAIDQPWIVTVPAGNVEALVEVLRRPLPSVPLEAGHKFHPTNHVREWLKAVTT